MTSSSLTAISSVDGRYAGKTAALRPICSEFGLIHRRMIVELRWFQALASHGAITELPPLSPVADAALEQLIDTFDETAAQRVKDIESVTNHDVKAVEYYLKEAFDRLGLHRYKEFIHFGLTSQDINNTAIPCSLKEAWIEILEPILEQIVAALIKKAKQWQHVPMLARTHGQPASPTSLGKELYVFVERLIKQKALLKTIPFSAKFGGATGNFNAHYVTYPNIDWIAFGDYFVNEVLGLERSKITTQIEHYDHLAAFCDNLKRINTILIDMDQDLWSYVSMNYFMQKIKENEVGSSTMPHKVNPIDFENSEGNLGVANAIFAHLSSKLPISRLQRDLTDSTVTRNIGVPLAHTLIAFKSLLKGLDKLLLNNEAIQNDLQKNWAVVTEAIQTILRREGYPEPYEALKALTRVHSHIDRNTILEFIESLDVTQTVKDELKKISPENYMGIYDF